MISLTLGKHIKHSDHCCSFLMRSGHTESKICQTFANSTSYRGNKTFPWALEVLFFLINWIKHLHLPKQAMELRYLLGRWHIFRNLCLQANITRFSTPFTNRNDKGKSTTWWISPKRSHSFNFNRTESIISVHSCDYTQKGTLQDYNGRSRSNPLTEEGTEKTWKSWCWP